MLAIHRAAGTWHNLIDRYIALSHFARNKFIEGGLPAERITVKPNCVEGDPGPSPGPSPEPGTGRGGYMLFAGRLSEEKGITTLLEAWRRLDRIVGLKIIGDGPLASQVRDAVLADARIEYLGYRSHPEVLAAIGDAAAVIVPSHCYETFGRVVVEAFSRATPAIVSSGGSPRAEESVRPTSNLCSARGRYRRA